MQSGHSRQTSRNALSRMHVHASAAALHPVSTLSRKRQLLELCARIGYTPPLA